MSRLHKPKAGAFIRFWVMVIFPTTTAFFKLRWKHLDRMPAPESGGVIVALNHTSSADTVLTARLIWSSGRVPRFMIKAGVFEWPVIGWLMKGAGQIPVHRGTADAAQSLRDAVIALNNGEAVAIYPEGTTTKDPTNWPMQGKTGIARLVLLCPDVPVVPVGQWGAHKGHGFHLGRRTSLASIGEPLDLSRFRDQQPSQRLQREITDEIMRAVRDQVAELRGETPPEEFFVPNRKYVDKKNKKK